MAIIKCSECGKDVSEKAAVCPNCGNPIGAAPAPNFAVPANTAEKPKKKKNFFIWVIVLIVLWALIAIWQKSLDSDYQKILVYGDLGASESYAEIENYKYVTPAGSSYSGTYTGDWVNDQPNGKGIFASSDGALRIDGNWENGQPNGICQYTEKSASAFSTYNGDFVSGEFNGNGETTSDYYDEEAAKLGFNKVLYKGEFSGGKKNGKGEMTVYYTDEMAKELGIDHALYKGEFSDDKQNGEGETMIFYTAEMAKELGFDYMVTTGQVKDGSRVEPYRYALYKDNQIIEEGTIKNGNRISD